MPHVELRQVSDGRKVCYALHSHTQWSMGAITEGHSTFLYRDQRRSVKQGDLVLINPQWPHACNPVDDRPWGYLMLYVDTGWLTRLRHDGGWLESLQWQDLATAVISDSDLYSGFCALAECLLDPRRELLEKQTELVGYLSALMERLAGEGGESAIQAPSALQSLAVYLDRHCTQEVSLDDLCTLTGYSAGHLIRTFRQYFGMTPHAYLINRRIQYSQRVLKQGAAIADTALSAGFADQSHFQRTFKRLVAATPRQYRQGSSEH